MKADNIKLGQSFTALKKRQAWKMPASRKSWEEAPSWVKNLGKDGLIKPEMGENDAFVTTITARKSRYADDFWVYWPGDFIVEGELLPIRRHEIELFYDIE